MKSKPTAYCYIRMSSAVQADGDSERRQLDAARSFAATHDLDFSEDRIVRDIGVSAFMGENIKSGELGRFFERVESGEIEPGAYLLIESLDRFSRDNPYTSLPQFMHIVHRGLLIGTTKDNRTYGSSDTDIVGLMTAMIEFARSHSESDHKRMRISEAWKRKRKEVNNQKLTALCPSWMRIADDRKSFELIPEKVQVVRQIFQMASQGMGFFSIVTRLNKDGVRAISGRGAWAKSSIAKIIQSRAVIGEFQPHSKRGGKRIPDGEPIPDYFPQIVTPDLFNSVQSAVRRRRQAGGGKKGKHISNLFTHLVKCGYCGSSMVYRNHGTAPRGSIYLTCSGVQKNICSHRLGYPYVDFENVILNYLYELDLQSLFNENAKAKEIAQLRQRMSAIDEEIIQIREKIDSVLDLVSQGVKSGTVVSKVKVLEATLESKIASSRQVQQEMVDIEEASVLGSEAAAIREYVVEIAKNYEKRAMLASRLATLISTITIFGSGLKRPENTALLEQIDDLTYREAVQSALTEADRQRHFPSIVVQFKNERATVISLYPDDTNKVIRASRLPFTHQDDARLR